MKTVTVKTVTVAQLKNRLNHYLRQVQRGKPILVADGDRLIARIDRVPHSSSTCERDADWLDRLERRGIVRRGSGRLSPRWARRAPYVKADVVGALLTERHGSR
jgi:antitoxin (DNA-binding transcriptional repressor) of toxin-antitoxin stability system